MIAIPIVVMLATSTLSILAFDLGWIGPEVCAVVIVSVFIAVCFTTSYLAMNAEFTPKKDKEPYGLLNDGKTWVKFHNTQDMYEAADCGYICAYGFFESFVEAQTISKSSPRVRKVNPYA